MSAAPEHKYTDRDVREDESLGELAIAYVRAYTGEFEPLVEAKDLYEEYGDLPVAVVRKVLNCMRHDAKVSASLPRPERRDNVLEFALPPKRRKIKYDDKQCEVTQSHDYHRWGENREHTCDGVPWPINRGEVRLPVRIKVPYAASKTGKLIHSIELDGTHQHWAIWRGPRHDWGYWSTDSPWRKSDADLSVKLKCKYPSYLRNPILIKQDELEKYMEIEDVLLGLRQMSMCPHCAEVEERTPPVGLEDMGPTPPKREPCGAGCDLDAGHLPPCTG